MPDFHFFYVVYLKSDPAKEPIAASVRFIQDNFGRRLPLPIFLVTRLRSEGPENRREKNRGAEIRRWRLLRFWQL
jgi:hypothetical protein